VSNALDSAKSAVGGVTGAVAGAPRMVLIGPPGAGTSPSSLIFMIRFKHPRPHHHLQLSSLSPRHCPVMSHGMLTSQEKEHKPQTFPPNTVSVTWQLETCSDPRSSDKPLSVKRPRRSWIGEISSVTRLWLA
jgi:hypothetical protein